MRVHVPVPVRVAGEGCPLGGGSRRQGAPHSPGPGWAMVLHHVMVRPDPHWSLGIVKGRTMPPPLFPHIPEGLGGLAAAFGLCGSGWAGAAGVCQPLSTYLPQDGSGRRGTARALSERGTSLTSDGLSMGITLRDMCCCNGDQTLGACDGVAVGGGGFGI